VVLVPIKPLVEAKSRLRGLFGDAARAELVRAMLTDTLAAVRAVYSGPVYLVTSDDGYDDIMKRFEVGRMDDLGRDYNSAVSEALRSEVTRAAGAALVLPADLPRAQPADILQTIEALRESEVVLVPAHDGGTGLLGLRPPGAIAPAFGVGSAAAHMEATRRAGLSLEILDCPSLARDIDSVGDLLEDADALGPATRAFLASHPVEGARMGLTRGRD
jgi:2-phospho-L-lactate guanylyltransferase